MCAHGHSHWGRLGAAGLLLARDGRVLLQLRARWVHRGSTWALPGGVREQGETAVEAALREAEEEMGLAASSVEVRGSRTADCGGWVYETVLGATVGSPSIRDRSESDGHRWVPADEVDALALHPAFRTAWSHPDGVLRDFVRATVTPRD